MDNSKTIDYINQSFLSPLFLDSDITDITYNGKSIFYLHNLFGRKKSDIIVSQDEVKDFIRQIANMCEKQFSIQNPYLDLYIGHFRLNAVFQSIARVDGEKCITFSLRISKDHPVITDESTFLNDQLICLFKALLQSKISITIGGQTGCGKTEFQKYLLSKMPKNTRVVIIDNTLELGRMTANEDVDFNMWQSDERNLNISLQDLIKVSLRSNPDWIIIAESRGKEMLEIFNSAMTGHPVITTIHAFDNETMPSRIARLILMNGQAENYSLLMKDIFYYFKIYVFLKRTIDHDGRVHRFIEEISEFDVDGKKNTIYLNKGGKIFTSSFLPETLLLLDYQDDVLFQKYYVRKK